MVVIVTSTEVVITAGAIMDCDGDDCCNSDEGDYGGVGEAVLDLKYVKETILELVVVVVVVTMMVMVTEKVADMDM